MRLMLGCHLRVRNPYSMGYFGYLACVDSWKEAVDRVLVVDGCSTDDSVEQLLGWVQNDPRVEVLANDLSHWGEDFRLEQSLFNKQLGHEQFSDCDWVIGIDADHVLSLPPGYDLESDLNARFADQLVVGFGVKYFYDGSFLDRKQPRPWILNNRLARANGIEIGWGLDARLGPVDTPILVESSAVFSDPETGVEKRVLIGDTVTQAPSCSISAFRCGHFFFDESQVLYKARRWDAAIAAYHGRPLRSDLEMKLNADLIGIKRFMSIEEILTHDFPTEVERVIRSHYRPGMLGGALYARNARTYQRLAKLQVRTGNATRKLVR